LTVTEARALEIIAAMGADPARWPADERAALLALVARPAVAAALRDAAALDALLGDWAGTEVAARPLDAATLIPAARVAAVPAPRRRWWAAGALAAAVAAAVVLTPLPDAPQTAQSFPQTPVPSATGASEAGDDAAFAYVFTPTVDEDALI
jgi:ferric-dicitrate binding protein FerR (iron transport regulator)